MSLQHTTKTMIISLCALPLISCQSVEQKPNDRQTASLESPEDFDQRFMKAFEDSYKTYAESNGAFQASLEGSTPLEKIFIDTGLKEALISEFQTTEAFDHELDEIYESCLQNRAVAPDYECPNAMDTDSYQRSLASWMLFDYTRAKTAQAFKSLHAFAQGADCLLYTSPSPRDQRGSRMPSSA